MGFGTLDLGPGTWALGHGPWADKDLHGPLLYPNEAGGGWAHVDSYDPHVEPKGWPSASTVDRPEASRRVVV